MRDVVEPRWIELDVARPAALGELNAFVALADALTDGDWDRPTGLPGWKVADLVCHVAGVPGYDYFAGRLRAGRLGGIGPNTNASPVVSGHRSEVIVVLKRAAAEFAAELNLLTSADLDRLLPVLPTRKQLVRSALGAYLYEFGLHRYDLESALDHECELPDEVVRGVVLMTETDGFRTHRVDGHVPRLATPPPEDALSYVLAGDTIRWEFSFTPGTPLRETSPTRNGNWTAGAVHERCCTVRGTDSAICLVLSGRISTHSTLVSSSPGFAPTFFTTW